MYNHINKLTAATDNIPVSYRLAYNDGPDVGVRGAINDNLTSDLIFIDDVAWLIAGDVRHIVSRDRLKRVAHIHNAMLNDLVVELRAQAIVGGKTLIAHLGTHKVVDRKVINDECGILYLAPIKY
jgi:hypothetical protein